MATDIPSHAEHSDDPGSANAYILWHSLQQHTRFREYYRQIRACLLCDDTDWYFYTCLRTNPRATNFIEDLHLSTIYLIPPKDIFNILLRLRIAPNWPAVRALVVTNMSKHRQPSFSTTSTRSSAISSRSAADFSSSSATTYSTLASSYSNINTVDEAASEEQLSHHPAQSESLRGHPIQTTGSGKASRKAPDGQRFTCPYQQCRGRYAFKRVGDFDRHIQHTHPDAAELNAYDHLKRDLHIITPSTPVKIETRDSSATLVPESSSSVYAQVDAFKEFPPSRPEVHLPMEQLTDMRVPMTSQSHYRNTGVHVLHSDNDAWTIPSSTQCLQPGSFLDLDDYDDDHMYH